MKTVYRQAEMLTEMGFDAYVFQPDGKPDWLKTSARVLTTAQQPLRDEILVFPENATGWVAERAQRAQRASSAQKVLFCQNQYYMFDSSIPPDVTKRQVSPRLFVRVRSPRDFFRAFFTWKISRLFPITSTPMSFFPEQKRSESP